MQSSTSTQPDQSAKAMEAANMIEVDPKLFVTCRLCLEDMGVYQIVPAIQQQIKYCFDIDVDPFDGLPQLLCKKCKSLLSDYLNTKKIFSEKQESLIKMKQDLKTVPFVHPQQDTVSSSQQINADSNLKLYHRQTSKPRRKRIISSTTESESDDSSTNTAITKAKSPSVTEFKISKSTSWESDYNKLFVCKLCNGFFRRKNAVLSHLRSHRLLMSKYQNILKTYCTVDLSRLDSKPNITGDSNKVVHSFKKITQEGNSYFYVIYVRKDTFDDSVKNLSGFMRSSKPVLKHIASDFSSVNEGQRDKRKSSSSDDGSIKRKRRKTRLLSACSNETLVIGNECTKSDLLENNGDDLKIKTFFGGNNAAHNFIDCIDIEDSSDSCNNKSNSGSKKDTVAREPIKVKLQDCKAIHNIISLCHKKYLRRQEVSDTQNKKSNKDHLKHKVLSIGRKIVTKRGFNCNGLLRYMESKNLELVWIQRTQQNMSTSYIQINAKLKTSKENVNDSNKSEWKTVTQTPQQMEEQEDTEAVKHHSSIPSSLQVDNDTRPDEITLPSSVVTIQYKGNLPLQTDCAVLYPEPNNSESKSKLLNENPVANPKHFPKKGNLTTPKQNVSNTICDELPNVADAVDNNASSLCLPVITSTHSLAVIESAEQSIRNNTTNNTQTSSENNIVAQQKPGPRIKVKPVTELLSERILNSIMNSQTNPQLQSPTLQIQNMSQPLQVVETSSCLGTSLRPSGTSGPQVPSTVYREYVILDTVEFPNTKTDSPFRYFKNLLQIHNIILLDTDYILPRDFTCLIKFKVLYKQETKDQPVILCLSLFCLKNVFCLKVKDRNQENINMSKISPNWQWELLKIYKGDVVNKLLQNALKVSQVTHEHTKTFLCLLESINYKTDT